MNETLAQIKQRKSVRVFEDRPIAPGVKQEIIGAALEPPPWR